MNWKHALLAAGGTAAASVALYYVLKDDGSEQNGKESQDGNSKLPKKVNMDEVTIEEVLEILNDIINSQNKMKVLMKTLTREIIANQYNFEKAYQKVREAQPEDPLERNGISMRDFDLLLDRLQNEPKVRDAITQIMGSPSPNRARGEVKQVSKQDVISVHHFMLEQLHKLVTEIDALPNKASYNLKTTTIAAQAIVGAKVEEKFNFTSEDIEAAVVAHHIDLSNDPEFAKISVLMQSTMARMMGEGI